MALLNDDLSLWEIGFRWQGMDPGRVWLRVPLPVRDNFRTLIDAILRLHLSCLTLSLERRTSESKAPPEFFIRYHLDDVEACIAGVRFSRKLLRWARIERWDMYLWCLRQGVPLPEFWFPPGWKLAYEWPEDGATATVDAELQPMGDAIASGSGNTGVSTFQPATSMDSTAPVLERDKKLRDNQKSRMACEIVAASLWKREPKTTIAAMVQHEAIQQLCGGAHYDESTVREWIKVVAPDAVRQRRGRPRQENPPEGK